MDLENFVVFNLNPDSAPSRALAYSQISTAMQAGFLQLAVGHRDGYKKSISYAYKVYKVYQKDVPKRNKMPAFAVLAANILRDLLIEPRFLGVRLYLVERSDLYTSLDDKLQRMIYPLVAGALRDQCRLEGLDFNKAFPKPPGPGANGSKNG